jgi:hypothetical protein
MTTTDHRWVVWWFEIDRDGKLQKVCQDFSGKQQATKFFHQKHTEGQRAQMGLISKQPWHYSHAKEQRATKA